jgi:DNA-directed RNA polymerase subunit RPC12/RpoP
MIKLSTLGVMLLALLIFGCGPSEESKPSQGSKETATEKVAEEAKKMGEVVVDKAVDMEKQAEPAVKEAVEKTKEMASQATSATKEVMVEAKDATVKAGEVVVETVKTAAVATTMAAGKAVDAAKQAVSPETIVLEASYGNVTFPHAMHSSSYDCSTCHGDATPGLFGLDKEKAHVLCKDCHKKIGAGPVDCKGCHKN